MVVLRTFYAMSSGTGTCSTTAVESAPTEVLPSMRDGLSFGLEAAWEAHQRTTVLRET